MTNRRRNIQPAYNAEHGILPETIRKHVTDILLPTRAQRAPVPARLRPDLSDLEREFREVQCQPA